MPSLVFPSTTTSLELCRDAEPQVVPTRDVQAEVLAVFDAHSAAVHRYVRSCGIPADVAEDIVQEAFVALFQHLRKGGSVTNLRGWVMQVGYRLALKHRRTEWRRGRWQGPWDAEAIGVPDPSAGPEDACTARRDQQRLRAVLKALPERDRQCVHLRAEGLRYREIAEVLGVSLGSVAKSLTRAMSRFMAAVEK